MEMTSRLVHLGYSLPAGKLNFFVPWVHCPQLFKGKLEK